MRSFGARLGLVACVAAALACGSMAVLQDHGPADPALGWPLWYRDTGGMAVGLCKSQDVSPDPNAAGGLMCFPIAPKPTPGAFAGNVGDEIFFASGEIIQDTRDPNFDTNPIPGYNEGVVGANDGGLYIRYMAALEAAYGGPTGSPVRGEEIVFARLRILIHTNKFYESITITHPFGEETFDNVEPGVRTVFWTEDIPVGALLDFEGCLNGRVGPFLRRATLQTSFVNFQRVTTLVYNPIKFTTASGQQLEFLGDPNVEQTFMGSPFNTNYLEVTGTGVNPAAPVGPQRDIFTKNTATIQGQVWTAPIAPKFTLQASSYSYDSTTSLTTVYVRATAPAGIAIVVDAGGQHFRLLTDTTSTTTYTNKFVFSGAPTSTKATIAALPTTETSVANVVTATLAPVLYEATAIYTIGTGTTTSFSVSFKSSDSRCPSGTNGVAKFTLQCAGCTPTVGTTIGTLAGIDTPVCSTTGLNGQASLWTYTLTLDQAKLAVPPTITAQGNGATQVIPVKVVITDSSKIVASNNQLTITQRTTGGGFFGQGGTVQPVALNNEGTGVNKATSFVMPFTITSNTKPSTVNVYPIAQPKSGVVAPNLNVAYGFLGATLASSTLIYTPNPGATCVAGADSFSVMIQDFNNLNSLSNSATLSLSFSCVAKPVAVADAFPVQINKLSALPVLENDVVTGGTIVTSSLTLSGGLTASGASLTTASASVTSPTAGTITVKVPSATGSYTQRYTVNAAAITGYTAQPSAPGTLTIIGFAATEAMSAFSTALYTRSSNRFKIIGTTSWANTNLNQGTVTCTWTDSKGAVFTIGTGSIDQTGGWTVDNAPTTFTPTPTSATTYTVTCTSSYNRWSGTGFRSGSVPVK